MRAALINAAGELPTLGDIEPPTATDGASLIDVDTAALGGWDIVGGAAYQMAVEYPMVVRGEGVGHTPDGERVYFGERSLGRFGAFAERTLVPTEEVWRVPNDVDDGLAITMAIAGTGALVPLQQAEIQPGENVLILGATGALGQVALQLSRYLGAGRVVAAGRNAEALGRMHERGTADAVAQLGTPNDAALLAEVAEGGFDVVLDVVYGDPFVAALKATRPGARIMSIGVQAGFTATVMLGDLLSRTHTCVGTGQLPPGEREAIWRRLMSIAQQERFTIDYVRFTLEQSGEAWSAQADSPHAKVLVSVSA